MIQIRLEEMHYIFSKQINGDVKRVRFNKVDIYERNGIISREAFALKILPVDFYLVLKDLKRLKKCWIIQKRNARKLLRKQMGMEEDQLLAEVLRMTEHMGRKNDFRK